MADENFLTKRFKGETQKQFQATDAQISAFVSRLDSFLYKHLAKLLAPISGKLSKGERDEAQKEATQVLGSLFTSLKQLGLDDELKQIYEVYGTQLKFIREQFEALGVGQVFSDLDRDIVKNLISFDEMAVVNHVASYVDDVKATVMRSVIAGEQPDFSGLHETVGARMANNVKAETQTLLQGFSRAVTVGKAKELGFPLFMYIGPDDKVTRPFCQKVLEQKSPPIYSIEEIQGMSNDQGLDVFTYGGGYNCRHDWRPVSEELARSMGWTP